MKPWVRILLLLVAVALFGWYAGSLDTGGLAAVFRELGWWIPALLLPFSLVYVVDTVAWGQAFADGRPVSFGRMFRIRWAGESVNNVVPSAYVGGEVVKAHLLCRRGVPVKTATASTVLSKTAQSVAQVAFIAAASLTFLQLAPDEPGMRMGMTVVVAGATAVVAGFFLLQRRGLFTTLLGWARRLRFSPRWIERMRPGAEASDAVTRQFYARHPRRFVASTGLYFAGWLLDTVEVFAFVWLSGVPISWPQALAVEAFTGIAKALGWFVPGSAGIQESGVLFFGRLAGIPDPVCLAYALFRRMREVAYTLVGGGLLASENGGWGLVRPGGGVAGCGSIDTAR